MISQEQNISRMTQALIEKWNSERYYAGRQILDIDIHEMFQFYGKRFFNDRLNFCTVEWSTRLIECAGICVYKGSASNIIYLSQPLLKFRNCNQLKQTLLHEMIHAYLFITNPRSCQAKGGHGTQFVSIMKQINEITNLNITVRHYFFDEVRYYKQHAWRCNGTCNTKKPFYGYVRKQNKQPPSMKDNWFIHHKRSCGGQFIKVQQPRRQTLDRSYKKKTSTSNNDNRGKTKKNKKQITDQKQKFNPFTGKATKLTDIWGKKTKLNVPNQKSQDKVRSNSFIPFAGQGTTVGGDYQQPKGFQSNSSIENRFE